MCLCGGRGSVSRKQGKESGRTWSAAPNPGEAAWQGAHLLSASIGPSCNSLGGDVAGLEVGWTDGNDGEQPADHTSRWCEGRRAASAVREE